MYGDALSVGEQGASGLDAGAGVGVTAPGNGVLVEGCGNGAFS